MKKKNIFNLQTLLTSGSDNKIKNPKRIFFFFHLDIITFQDTIQSFMVPTQDILRDSQIILSIT